MSEDYEPIRVKVASSDVPMGGGARPEVKIVPTTVVLTANDPVKPLLPQSDLLEYVIIQSLDNSCVVSASQGDAGSKGNQDTGLAYPVGAVIPTGVVIPLRGSNALWVTAPAFPSRISVFAAYRYS